MEQNVSDNKWKNVQKIQTIQPVEKGFKHLSGYLFLFPTINTVP